MSQAASSNTESKNQHFVPRFYLGRFSVGRKEREIKVYAFNAQKFILAASIKGQAAQGFYYGKDGKTEKRLMTLEGKWAEALRRIETETVPSSSSRLHFELLEFVISTDVRNPVRKLLNQTAIDENAVTMKLQIVGNQVKQIPAIYSPVANKIIDDWVDNAKLQSVEHMLKKTDALIKIASDLRLAVVANNTEMPFITSDYPIVFYNQLLETKTGSSIGSAYASLGCQIFFPICDRFLLMFYDSKMYNLTGSGRRVLATRSDVDQLNKLQVLNSVSAVYGNECFTADYLHSLIDERSRARPKKSLTFPNNRVDLQLSFLALSSGAIKLIIKPRTLPKRKKAMRIIKVVGLMKNRKKNLRKSNKLRK